MFEAYKKKPNSDKYFTHSTLKVISDDATPVSVQHLTDSISITKYHPGKVKWDKITNRKELKKTILQHNKRHLQQVAYEEGIPLPPEFQDLLSNMGTSPAADKILDNALTTELKIFRLPRLRRKRNYYQLMEKSPRKSSSKRSNWSQRKHRRRHPM